MADPTQDSDLQTASPATLDDPWEPHWLPDLHPTDQQHLSRLFADVHPDDQIPHDHPIDVAALSGIGIPNNVIEQALAAPQPARVDGPVMHPEQDSPGPVTSPNDAAPPMFADTPVTHPDVPAPSVRELFDPENPDAIGSVRIESHAEQYSGDPLANPVQSERDDAAQRMALEDPIGYEKLRTLDELDRENHLAVARLKASEHDRWLQEQNLANYQRAYAENTKKMEALDAQAADIASRNIDPSRYWSSRTTGQRIASYIGAIAGGMRAGMKGSDGRNHFLEQLEHTIDQDIDAQKADIENARQGVTQRRGILAEEFARTGDLHQAAEAVRLGSLKRVYEDMLTQQGLYEPGGTRYFAIGDSARKVVGLMDQSRLASQDRDLKRRIEEGKIKIDALAELRQRDALNETIRHNKATEEAAAAKAARGAAGGGRLKPEPIVMSRAQYAAENHLSIWGTDTERAYQEYSTNQERAKAEWAKTGGRSGGGAALAPAASGATASGPSAPTAPAGTGRRGVARPPAAAASMSPTSSASAAAEQPKRYQSEDDWYETNAPTVKPEEQKRYWFVDGDNGNEVPPVKLSGGIDPEKFLDKQRIRREMAVKADQLRVLTEKLQKRGAWSKGVTSKISWTNDEDAQEARALGEDFVGLVIQAKGMGVPSGNDVERVKTMVGGDPAGWQNPLPNLQRARESLQLEQNADWDTAAPKAARDARYNKYRVLPGAAPEWVKKFEHRGEVKEVSPELGNTDPKQLTPKPVSGDAPSTKEKAAGWDMERRTAEASAYLQESGAVPDPDFEAKAAALTGASSSRAFPTPQVNDYVFKGPPGAADDYSTLRTQYVNNVALLNRYMSTHKPDDWTAYKQGLAKTSHAVEAIFGSAPTTYQRWESTLKASDRRLDDPALLGKITGDILRSGGR
jgi:hypothetical protein